MRLTMSYSPVKIAVFDEMRATTVLGIKLACIVLWKTQKITCIIDLNCPVWNLCLLALIIFITVTRIMRMPGCLWLYSKVEEFHRQSFTFIWASVSFCQRFSKEICRIRRSHVVKQYPLLVPADIILRAGQAIWVADSFGPFQIIPQWTACWVCLRVFRSLEVVLYSLTILLN